MDNIKELKQISSQDELNIVIGELLTKIGLIDVKRIYTHLISAKEQTPLESREIYFVSTINDLTSKDQEISKIIKEIPSSTDTIYIVSSKSKISGYFQNWIEKEQSNRNFKYWSAEELVQLIDQYIPEFWASGKSFLRPYNDYFSQRVSDDIELRSLLKLDDKYLELLDIFIEPKLNTYVEDEESGKLIKKGFDRNRLAKSGSYIISGDAGTGKSTLLKEIGKRILSNNIKNSGKNIPILLKVSDIFSSNFDIKLSIDSILLKVYNEYEVLEVFNNFSIVLLIDSLDDFEKDKQVEINKQIEDLVVRYSIRYIICTRSYEYFIKECNLISHKRVTVENFNITQIKDFVNNFFRFDNLKADSLIQSLEENNILDKIPLTPLTLSVISILYEERQYEIPATITDVYDNFNLFLLGRISIKSNLEFLDINIKERILSLYALNIISDTNRKRKNRSEFIIFIEDFFTSRSISIDKSLIPELINSLTQGTGVLIFDELENVNFMHDLFMEYYASLEIFKQERSLEDTLIERFTDFNWQNTSIFYAGRTKDMPEFLRKLIERVKKYYLLNDCLIASSGLGYILQALWLTNSRIRKDGIIEALNLIVKADVKIKELAAQKFPYFVGIREPDIAILNLIWFYRHFSSITLKDSLNLSFDELYNKLSTINSTYFQSDKKTLQFQLFCISLVLSSNKINLDEKLERLFNENKILNDPLFILLFDFGIDLVNPKNSNKLKIENKIDNKKRKYHLGYKYYIENTADDLRLTTWENIKPFKNIEIYTEGKTDAEIIEHAFKVLTDNYEPYWHIRACNNLKKGSAGANELSKFLMAIAPKIDNDADREKIIIGIFDNDAKGIQEFNSLKSGPNGLFDLINSSLKKHKDQNIYAIKLPIPEDKLIYQKSKIELNYFSIEHYFSLEYLQLKNMVKESELNGVYEITGDKAKFSKKVLNESDANLFIDFKYLLEFIDSICNKRIEYYS